MSKPKRRFVEVKGRRVHLRQAGSGPPLVMLHGSPGNSEMMAHEMEAASRYFTCFALDAPGFGSSDPLAGDTLQVKDLAHATADAMEALDLPPCCIFGTHSGAAIGAEIGVVRPERVTGLVLDGFPIFTEAEIAVIFKDYFEPMVPDPLGGHLTSTWVRFRDQFTWFPWNSRNVTRLNPVDRPTPEEIHHWVMMFYRSCKTYAPAYRAVCTYGQGAYRAAAALQLPTVFMASAEDMLYPHLGRLPPLKAGQRIEELPYDPPAKFAALVEFARGLPQPPATAPRSFAASSAGIDPAVRFVDAAQGQVFVRSYGNPQAPALILLHDSPGSGLALEPVARELAAAYFVLVPDLPGHGESDAPSDSGKILEAGADAVSAVADAFSLQRFQLASTGMGCTVAAVFIARQDARLVDALLDAMPQPDDAAAGAIAPELSLSPDGSHWVRAWLMVRDTQIYQPWFDGSVAAQRRRQGNFGAQWLHDQTFEIMKARESYHLLARAALRFDAGPNLAAAAVPIRFAKLDDFADALRSTFLS